MSIKLLLGVNNSGKTKYIFDEIEKDLEAGVTPIAIVPSQMRLVYEKEYLNKTQNKGLLDLDITSFSRLTEKFINQNSIDRENYLSKLDKTILLRKLITKNNNIFKIYDKVKNKEGFWASIDIFVDLLKKEQKSADELKLLDIKNKDLKYKFAEIVGFYEIFSKELGEKFQDSIDDMQLFLENIKNLKEFENSNVYIDGYNNFSKKELSLIFELANMAKNVYISLVTDIKNVEGIYTKTEENMYVVADTTLSIICDRAARLNMPVETKSFVRYKENRSNELNYINDNLFISLNPKKLDDAKDNVKIIAKKNPYYEADEAAKEITKLIRNGYRYNDIAIFVGDLEHYLVPIKKTFYDYELSYYMNRKEKITTNSLIIYIVAMLETIKMNYDSKSILKFLKTGLVDISYEDVCYIENYILEYNINYAKKWNKPFVVYKSTSEYAVETYDEERLNEIREKILNQIHLFNEPFEKDNKAEVVASQIYKHISEGSIFANYNEQIKKLKENGLIYYSKVYSQVINKVVDILDSLVRVYKDEIVTFKEFCSIFEYSIKEMELTAFSNNIDEITVSEIGSSRIENKKVIFILGANDEKVPKMVKENIIFSDKDLEELKGAGLDMRETSQTKNLMEEYNVNQVIETAEEKLYIMYSISEIDGTGLQKSNIVTQIEKMLGIKREEKIEEEITLEDSLYSKRLFTSNCLKAIYNLAKEGDLENKYEKWGLIYKEYKTEKMKEVLKYVRSQRNLDKETLDLIYKDEVQMSVSKLEKFNKCPFSYYMQYTLKAKERKIYEVTPADLGNFMHKVIENFSDFIIENDATWHEMLIDKRYEPIVNAISEKVVSDNPKVFGEGKRALALQRQLILRTKNVVKMIAESFNNSEFVQLGQEIEFKKGTNFAPIEVKLEDGTKMCLNGKIDRIDVYETESKVYAKVVDYKLSRKDITIDTIREGITLQLMTYMSALVKSGDKIFKGKEIVPAAALYCTLAKPRISGNDTLNEEKLKSAIVKKFRLNGIFISDVNIIEKMDKNYKDSKQCRLELTNFGKPECKNALSETEFIDECKNIENILKQIGSNIKSGVVKINPKKTKNKFQSPCEYCEFAKVCRKNGVC